MENDSKSFGEGSNATPSASFTQFATAFLFKVSEVAAAYLQSLARHLSFNVMLLIHSIHTFLIEILHLSETSLSAYNSRQPATDDKRMRLGLEEQAQNPVER